MRFIYGFIIAAFLVASSTQTTTPVKKCAEGTLPTDVRVDGCTKNPCPFVRGTNVTAEWDFTVPEDTTALKPRVRATVMGLTIDYPFPQDNACETLKSVSCPLKAGQTVTYMLNMPILKKYPKTPLVVEFGFLDDNDKVVVCYKLPAKVVDK